MHAAHQMDMHLFSMHQQWHLAYANARFVRLSFGLQFWGNKLEKTFRNAREKQSNKRDGDTNFYWKADVSSAVKAATSFFFFVTTLVDFKHSRRKHYNINGSCFLM